MAVVNRNTPLLHRKEFQMMSPPGVGAGSGVCFATDPSGNADDVLAFVSNTSIWLYSHSQDGWLNGPSGAIAGTFGAGTSIVRHPWSANYTANGGSTTTVTVASATHNIGYNVVGSTIEFLSAGTASGFRTTITNLQRSLDNATITLTLAATAPTAILNTHTFRLNTGRYFVMGAGTLAAGSFKAYDTATSTWGSNLSITGLAASMASDCAMATQFVWGETYASGTATSATSTTLVNSAKTWTTNQWQGYQVRITAGTGIGQIRTIASNTGTTLTVATWTTTPDATSQYVIEGNEDFIYHVGNASTGLTRYSISGNSWTAMATRASATSTGVSLNIVGKTDDATWADESNIRDGRYLFSLRGNSSAIDRYDIAANSWSQLTYVNANETYTTGSGMAWSGKYLYIRKDATNRFYRFDVTSNDTEPLTSNMFGDGTAVVGQGKIWVKNLDTAKTVVWLYSVGNTNAQMHRVMLF